MNLFVLLGMLGLADDVVDEPLLPLGTVYDPFICRGLDALIDAMYSGARLVLVATPSGITLSPEGGAHQSTITPTIGLGLAGLTSCRAGLRRGARLVAVLGATADHPLRTGGRRTCG